MRIVAKLARSFLSLERSFLSLESPSWLSKRLTGAYCCLIGQIIARGLVFERARFGRRHSWEMRWKERLRALRRKQGRPERQLLDIPLCSSRITLQLENMTMSKIGPRINCFVVCRSWCLSLAVFTKFQTVYTVWGHGAGLDCLPTDLWGLRA